ncbi:hypothetical protein IQ247_28975 [Plectonema cf. radiosum LEGE 06105]|uniref:Uncharacterized protein n=1 Tax=Plectonema cf. radiosum LEGE 06105 TaxID=945769 RepID=A0A8J7K466_9CYAN|nr:DUF5691 domain-containing protein [Plectonema radiosum]MBE9216646.1 hypothetical protein [Plectonema cf. radiosum LEGE 06105]
MNIWQNLVKTAVVGTQRQELKIITQNNQFDEVFNSLDMNDRQGSLLAAAGTISLYQQAGKLITIEHKITSKTCELDDLPYCNQLSEQHLQMMLSGEYSAFLPEWLKITAKAGKLVSPKYLPELLTLGKRQHYLRKDILAVLGKRGIWLAAQNPEWNYAISENTDKIWKSGSLESKKKLLTELRQSQAAKGRKQLQNIWSKEKSQERASLLETLEVSLSIEDETFLEEALDDKSKLVRDAAARLLLQIPESKLVKRMIERVRPLLNLDNNNLEVTLPNKCTLEMTQDGIDESKYIPSLGEKASLLLQMLGCVPPNILSNDWRKNPDELIKIVATSKWEKLFLEAWVMATIRSKDTAWAEALLKVTAKLCQHLSNTDDLIQALLNILSDSQAQNLILDVLLQFPNIPFNSANPAFALLINTPYIWNQELSQAVISSIKNYLESNHQVNNWQFSSALEKFSLQIDASTYHHAADNLTFETTENIHKSVIDAIDNFLVKLQFRYEIIKALNSVET